MAKVLRCRDVGLDCEGEIRAETEEEIMRQAAEHAQAKHNMTEMSPEVVQKVWAAIRDEQMWEERLPTAREAPRRKDVTSWLRQMLGLPAPFKP